MKNMTKLLTTVAVLLSLTSVASASCEVTKTGYQNLKTGMTYEQAKAVLGCEGEEIVENEIGRIRTVMYKWDGRGGLGANMSVMFQNGKLMMKAQYGLQ